MFLLTRQPRQWRRLRAYASAPASQRVSRKRLPPVRPGGSGLRRGRSYPFTPLAVVSRGMDNGHDCDQIAFHAVHNPIWKLRRQKPTSVTATIADSINERIGGQGVDGAPDRAGEISSQAL